MGLILLCLLGNTYSEHYINENYEESDSRITFLYYGVDVSPASYDDKPAVKYDIKAAAIVHFITMKMFIEADIEMITLPNKHRSPLLIKYKAWSRNNWWSKFFGFGRKSEIEGLIKFRDRETKLFVSRLKGMSDSKEELIREYAEKTIEHGYRTGDYTTFIPCNEFIREGKPVIKFFVYPDEDIFKEKDLKIEPEGDLKMYSYSRGQFKIFYNGSEEVELIEIKKSPLYPVSGEKFEKFVSSLDFD